VWACGRVGEWANGRMGEWANGRTGERACGRAGREALEDFSQGACRILLRRYLTEI
jgi:hypothetical protein